MNRIRVSRRDILRAIPAAGVALATSYGKRLAIAQENVERTPLNRFPRMVQDYFVDRVDRIVIDMEESAQKMIDAVHAIERGTA